MKFPGIDTDTDFDNESLDELAAAGRADDKLKFRNALMLLLTVLTKLRQKVSNDDVDSDDATALVHAAAAFLKDGSKPVFARQPLELGSPASNGGLELGAPDDPKVLLARNIADSLKGKSDKEIERIMQHFIKAANGDYDNVQQARDEKEQAEAKLKEYDEVITKLDATPRRDKAAAIRRAVDGITNAVTVTTGVPQADHDKVVTERDKANAELTKVTAERDSLKANPTLVGKVKAALKRNPITRTVTLDEKKLDDTDLKALGLEKK